MSSLLPVLREHDPRMSLCSVCPKPGHCCSGFQMYQHGEAVTFWAFRPFEDAQEFAAEYKLPFEPLKIGAYYATKRGHLYVTMHWRCKELQSDGRCGIYERRPHLCRSFIPTTDKICVFHKEAS